MAITTTEIPFNYTPTLPSLKDLLDKFKQDIMINFNCHHIGTIETFNSLLQTAKATINYQKTYFNLNPFTKQFESQLQEYPILIDCPVIVLGGASTALTFPIKSGDECLVLFNDRDMDNWFAGSNTAGVATPRLHSFSDGVILVGLNSLPNVWLGYDTTRAMLRAGDVPGTITAVAVNPSNSKILMTNTYPVNTITMNTLLQTLITDLQTLITALTMNAATFIAVTGSPGNPSPLNPVIVTALTAVSTSLSTLATEIGVLLE